MTVLSTRQSRTLKLWREATPFFYEIIGVLSELFRTNAPHSRRVDKITVSVKYFEFAELHQIFKSGVALHKPALTYIMVVVVLFSIDAVRVNDGIFAHLIA